MIYALCSSIVAVQKLAATSRLPSKRPLVHPIQKSRAVGTTWDGHVSSCRDLRAEACAVNEPVCERSDAVSLALAGFAFIFGGRLGLRLRLSSVLKVRLRSNSASSSCSTFMVVQI